MAPTLACMAGMAIYRLQAQGRLTGQSLGRRDTPFGPSEEIVLVDAPTPYYVVARHGTGKYRLSASFVNHRAILYALKDLGVRHVVGWSAAGAVSHSLNVGDLVIPTDLIDRTTRRANTCFEQTGLGVLRQFPVFCPALGEAMALGLADRGVPVREKATLVVTEGPRLETPAEIRLHAAGGAELVGHSFAPEAFLAKELQLCFAGLAYVANYAETGSRHRPFSANDLFGGLAGPSEGERTAHAIDAIADLTDWLAGYLAEHPPTCECDRTMAYEARKFGLGDDWRQWFGQGA